MKKILILYFICASVNAQEYKRNIFDHSETDSSGYLWERSFNDSVSESNYSVTSKLDNEDNVIIIARGTNNSSAGVDYVILKYNSNGEKLWNRRFNGTGTSINMLLTTDWETEAERILKTLSSYEFYFQDYFTRTLKTSC